MLTIRTGSAENEQLLLLAVDVACKDAGIQIPYDKVAKLMGENVSASMIRGHMGKIRRSRQKEGLPCPDPPRVRARKRMADLGQHIPPPSREADVLVMPDVDTARNQDQLSSTVDPVPGHYSQLESSEYESSKLA